MKILKLAMIAIVTSDGSGMLAANPPQEWTRNCAVCHGPDGGGKTSKGKQLGILDFRQPKAQADFTDAEAEQTIKNGVNKSGNQQMPAFRRKLSQKQIKALVGYIRSLKK